ncbi:MAG: ribonuclease P protein component [Gammaproteobacteria bacterium]|nr:ribonuclease P protein component [Gammaproteobacteria bacterium]
MSDGTARFPKRARLLKPAEFSRVFKDPIRSSDRLFTILAVSSAESDNARLGLAISKKHAKRAIDRNRIKRIVRESFRHQQPLLPAIDFVVMARDDTTRASNQELFASLTQHWKRLCAKLPAKQP